jgi:hypothetical protein
MCDDRPSQGERDLVSLAAAREGWSVTVRVALLRLIDRWGTACVIGLCTGAAGRHFMQLLW